MRGWSAVTTLPDTSLSGLYTVNFRSNGTASNEWMDVAGCGERSDEVPAILPFASTMIGFTYSWRDRNDEAGIRLFRAAATANNNSATLVYSLNISNRRCGSVSTNVSFSAGDKIAMYLQDRGGDPRDPFFAFYFVPTATTFANVSDNLNTDF